MGCDADPKYPGPYRIEPKWVFGVVIGFSLASISVLIKKVFSEPEFLNLKLIGETVVTFFTGLWYWIRFHYTESATSEHKHFTSLLWSVVMGLTGISCFFVAGLWLWSIVHAAVLLLGTEKDLEIIIYQRRKIIQSSNKPTNNTKWRAQMLVFHHWYSMVRDLSMAMWWAIYGIVISYFVVPGNNAILLFGIPYIVLVVCWCAIKVRTYNTELSLKPLENHLPSS